MVRVKEGAGHSTYECLAGCTNKKNLGSNVFKISGKQGAQAVTEHCESRAHFHSLCRNQRPEFMCFQKQLTKKEIDAKYDVEVMPYARRGATQRGKAVRQNRHQKRQIKQESLEPDPLATTRKRHKPVDNMESCRERIASLKNKYCMTAQSAEAMANQASKLGSLSR